MRVQSLLRIPLYLGFLLSGSARPVVERDVLREHEPRHGAPLPARPMSRALFDVAAQRPEWRTLFFHRLRAAGGTPRVIGGVLRRVYGCERTLHLHCPALGPGLHIRHGFATIVDAASVGADCLLSQQVTVGWTDRGGPPIIGDRVQIHAGAMVLGPIRVGDDAIIGAGAVVLRDVDAGTTVVGVPARPVVRPTSSSLDT